METDKLTTTEREVRRIVQLYKDVFGTKTGQKCLEDMASRYEKRSSHVPGDPYSTAFYEGQRAVVLRIKLFMEKDYDSIKKMMGQGVTRSESVFTATMDEEEIVDGDRP